MHYVVFSWYLTFDFINIWSKNSNLSLKEDNNMWTTNSIGNIKKIENNKSPRALFFFYRNPEEKLSFFYLAKWFIL